MFRKSVTAAISAAITFSTLALPLQAMAETNEDPEVQTTEEETSFFQQLLAADSCSRILEILQAHPQEQLDQNQIGQLLSHIQSLPQDEDYEALMTLVKERFEDQEQDADTAPVQSGDAVLEEEVSEEVQEDSEKEYLEIPSSGGILEEGSYRLEKDTYISNTLIIGENTTVELDLNGYVLSVKPGLYKRVIQNNGTLTITDSNPDTIHYGVLYSEVTGSQEGMSAGLWEWTPNAQSGVAISGGIITNGRLAQGPGIYSSGTLYFNGGTLAGNYYSGHGGALVSSGSMASPASLYINGGKVLYNWARGNGVVYVHYSHFYFEKGLIAHNRASYGGGLFVEGLNTNLSLETIISGSDAQILSNYASQGGGGVYVSTNEAWLQVKNGLLESNWIEAANDSTSMGESANDVRCNGAKITISGGRLGYVDSRPLQVQHAGGAIYMSGGQVAALLNKDGSIYISGGQLGYVMVQEGTLNKEALVEMSGGLLDAAYASGYADNPKAGMDITGGNLIFSGGTIQNIVQTQSAVRVSGGNVYLEGGTIKNCQADTGGALHVSDGNVLMTEGTLQNNQALQGGAIFMDGGTLELSGGTLSQNQASQDGGAVYIQGGVLTIGTEDSSSPVLKNNTAVQGGAVFVKTALEDVILYSGDFVNNRAESSQDQEGLGGSILVEEGSLVVYGGLFQSDLQKLNADKGGAICVLQGSVRLDAVKIESCSAKQGGGVYVEGGDVQMGVFGQDDSLAWIDGCKAEQQGGALYLKGGSFQLYGGTFSENEAREGGGVYVHGGSFLMEDGILKNNLASLQGGALLIQADDPALDLNVEVRSGSIIENEARKNGGGLVVDVTNGVQATVKVGLEACKGLDASAHKTDAHPVIENNSSRSGASGLALISDDASSLMVYLYCGTIAQNSNLENAGERNVFQQGGTLLVYGAQIGESTNPQDPGLTVTGGTFEQYQYENGKWTLPELIEVYYMLQWNEDQPYSLENLTKGTDYDVAYITKDSLVNLPAYSNSEGQVVVAWYKERPNSETYLQVGSGQTMSEQAQPAGTLYFFAIFAFEGQGITDASALDASRQFAAFEGLNDGEVLRAYSNSVFSLYFKADQIGPDYYKDRILSFSYPLSKGTVLTLADLSGDKTRYYSYIASGQEKSVSFSQFESLEQPGLYFEPAQDQTDGHTEEYIVQVALESTEDIKGEDHYTYLQYVPVDSNKGALSQIYEYQIDTGYAFGLKASASQAAQKETVSLSWSSQMEQSLEVPAQSLLETKGLTLKIQADSSAPADWSVSAQGQTWLPDENGAVWIPVESLDGSLDVEVSSQMALYTGQNLDLTVSLCRADTRQELAKTSLQIGSGTKGFLLPTLEQSIYYSTGGQLSSAVIDLSQSQYDAGSLSWKVQKKQEDGSWKTETVQASLGSGFLTVYNLSQGTWRIEMEIQKDGQVTDREYSSFIVL